MRSKATDLSLGSCEDYASMVVSPNTTNAQDLKSLIS